MQGKKCRDLNIVVELGNFWHIRHICEDIVKYECELHLSQQPLTQCIIHHAITTPHIIDLPLKPHNN